jgi:hypothetical protein
MLRLQRGQRLQPHGGRRHHVQRPAVPDILRTLLQSVGSQHEFTLSGHPPSPQKPLNRERPALDGRSEDGFGFNSARGGRLNRSFYHSRTAGASQSRTSLLCHFFSLSFFFSFGNVAFSGSSGFHYVPFTFFFAAPDPDC